MSPVCGLGRRVKRGEKGIAIFAPMVAKTRKDDAKNSSEDDNRPSLLGFRRVYVWDESQILFDEKGTAVLKKQ